MKLARGKPLLFSSAGIAGLAVIALALNISPAKDRAALETAPTSIRDLCMRHTTTNRRSFVRMNYNLENMMAMINDGGLLGGGLCWWNSRFQRAATYLAYYSPNKPKPTAEEAREIVRKIAHRESVVEIPGYPNLLLFSYAYRDIVQAELERWQLKNALPGVMRTINPFRDSAYTSDSKLPSTIENLRYLTTHQNMLGFALLQIKGLTAHAWLVLDVRHTRRPDAEYEIDAVDSNYPLQVLTFPYRKGATQLFSDRVDNGDGFAIYVDFMDDYKSIDRAVSDACPTLYIEPYSKR